MTLIKIAGGVFILGAAAFSATMAVKKFSSKDIGYGIFHAFCSLWDMVCFMIVISN